MSESLPLVFVIGDSISIHYGPYLEKYLHGSFRYARKSGESAALENLDIPKGANGGDSRRVLNYLRVRLQEENFRPHIMLINCGLHDIKTDPEDNQRIPISEYEGNLRAIVKALAEVSIPLVWVCTTHVVDTIHNTRTTTFRRHAKQAEAYSTAASKIMQEAGIPELDLYTFTRNLGEDASLFCDHVHFHEGTREKQGAFIAGWLAAWKNLRLR